MMWMRGMFPGVSSPRRGSVSSGDSRLRFVHFAPPDRMRRVCGSRRRFGAGRAKTITAAAARAAREIVGVGAFVAGSIGPLGKPLEPFGHISAAQAEHAFTVAAEGLIEGGSDCFILETFQDLNEILAALRAVRRISADLPVI